jgi:HAD superfamily hydrolase (TIGR01490 family)
MTAPANSTSAWDDSSEASVESPVEDSVEDSVAVSVESSSMAAFFDVDGTLVSTHIVHQYIFARRERSRRRGGVMPGVRHSIWKAAFLVKCLHYLYLDRVSRSRMNIAFYRNYAGLAAEEIHDLADACFQTVLRPNLFDPGVACVREHLKHGRRVALVTGSLDFFIKPLATFLSEGVDGDAPVDVVARSLETRDGRFTGALDGAPIGEEEKAEQMRQYASRHGVTLADSHAYGDSIADLAMLECVGNPHAVNPDRELDQIARERGWDAMDWRASRNRR